MTGAAVIVTDAAVIMTDVAVIHDRHGCHP
jgi:hypothetical protein